MLKLALLFFLERWRNRASLGAVIGFFLATSMLSALILQRVEISATTAYAVIWIILVLAVLLSLEQLFAEDARTGIVYDLYQSSHPLWLIILIKVVVHWGTILIPLSLFLPLIAELFFQIAYENLLISLLLGSPTLVLLGGVFYSLTLLHGSSLLAPFMVIPLYTPIVIFGVSLASTGDSSSLLWLAALFCLAVAFLPIAIGAILKETLSDYL